VFRELVFITQAVCDAVVDAAPSFLGRALYWAGLRYMIATTGTIDYFTLWLVNYNTPVNHNTCQEYLQVNSFK
jgi:hypothetical protein